MLAKCLFTAILAASLASAQRGGGGGMGNGEGGIGGEGGPGMGGAGTGGAGMAGGMPRVQRQSKFEIVAEKLKLNKDQKDQVQTIFLAAMEESRPVAEQITKARETIAGAMISGTGEADIRKCWTSMPAWRHR